MNNCLLVVLMIVFASIIIGIFTNYSNSKCKSEKGTLNSVMLYPRKHVKFSNPIYSEIPPIDGTSVPLNSSLNDTFEDLSG